MTAEDRFRAVRDDRNEWNRMGVIETGAVRLNDRHPDVDKSESTVIKQDWWKSAKPRRYNQRMWVGSAERATFFLWCQEKQTYLLRYPLDGKRLPPTWTLETHLTFSPAKRLSKRRKERVDAILSKWLRSKGDKWLCTGVLTIYHHGHGNRKSSII